MAGRRIARALHGFRRSAALGFAVLLAGACLDDTLVATATPGVRATLSASLAGAMAGGTVRIRVGYRTRARQFAPLPASPEQIAVAAGTTVVLPLTVDIGPCLADKARVPEGEPGCKLIIELTLADAAGGVIDTQTREADGAPATPGQSVDFGTVTIGVQVGTVVVTPASLGMNVSQEQPLSATVRDPAGAVVTTVPITWTTSDASVAQLSATTGATITVRALKLGSATVSATAGGKTSNQVAVSVVPPAPLTVRQRPATGCVIVGQTVTLDVDAPPGAVAWTISHPDIATIGATTGVVTGVSAGQATVTATSGNRTGTAAVCVVGPLAVSPTSLSITAGRSGQLTVANSSGADVSFASSATSVATVDGSGLVRGAGIGQATVTTTLTAASGTQTASTPVTVTAGGITVTPASPRVALSRLVRLTAVVQDADGRPLTGVPATWSIADPSVGGLSTTSGTSVDVRGLKVGTTTVRATAGGVTVSVPLTVIQPLPPASIEKVAGDDVTCATRSAGCTFIVRVVDVNGTPVADAAVEWSTSYECANPMVTGTDDEGLASAVNMCSAVSPGTYTQTATLLANQQQVTFSYTLRGLTLTFQSTDSAGTTTFTVTSGSTAATGLDASIAYRSGPATNYVTNLALDATSTPAVLTFSFDPYSLPSGDYTFDLIVTTTTPGLGPGVETFEFSNVPSLNVQPTFELRRVHRGSRPAGAVLDPPAALQPRRPP